VCTVWFVSLAFLNRGVFTSENAFKPVSAHPTFGMVADREAHWKQFEQLKERVKQTFQNEFHNNTKKGSNAKHINAVKMMVENETKRAFETYN
jgi:hypothetical protein